MEPTKKNKSFGGWVEFYTHESKCCKTSMNFVVYLPPQVKSQKLPVLYFLSGLTCTEENFITKSGAQEFAAKEGIILVAPDTSPRKTGIPDEDKDWEVGSGASFYVNATRSPWSKHFKMYDFITQELPELIQKHFPVIKEKQSISGHSMGGHGAIMIGLRNPEKYQSISAFSPICAPSLCLWGKKAFSAFLGENPKAWENYDSHCLVQNAKTKMPLFIDQGTEDEFLKDELMTSKFEEACKQNGYPLTLRMQEGYDHSYFFIASFIKDHIEYHAKFLKT